MASNEILDSWEDFKDFDAPTKKATSNSKGNSKSSESVIVTEDTHRTQYKPQIRILKREPLSNPSNDVTMKKVSATLTANGSEAESLPGSSTAAKPKTLAQREAEYAEARRRILGPTYSNPEDQTAVPPIPSLVPPYPPPAPSLAQLVPPYPPPLILPNSPTPRTPPLMPSRTEEELRRGCLTNRMENLRLNSNVVRQPNGPDGTRGFSGHTYR